MNHERLVFCSLMSKYISELLRESNNKQVYVNLFAENNKHYDFDNLSIYDVYEISVIAINNASDLVAKNYDCIDEIATFLKRCELFIDEMEYLKK